MRQKKVLSCIYISEFSKNKSRVWKYIIFGVFALLGVGTIFKFNENFMFRAITLNLTICADYVDSKYAEFDENFYNLVLKYSHEIFHQSKQWCQKWLSKTSVFNGKESSVSSVTIRRSAACSRAPAVRVHAIHHRSAAIHHSLTNYRRTNINIIQI